jgi:NAD+ synthase (glutamine-hydrolysing)
MYQQGILKVAAATPPIEVGNIPFNTKVILNILNGLNTSIVVFPELTITGYSASDMFYQEQFLNQALSSLNTILKETTYQGIYLLGIPLDIYGALYNTAVVCQKGRILGVVPKFYIPNHHEFYEKRWFHSGRDSHMKSIFLLNQEVPFGTLIFLEPSKNIRFGVEICQDLWATYAPSDDMSLAGANVIFNLSASSEYMQKDQLRRVAVLDHSRKQMGAYIYTSTGTYESTSEVSYSPHQLIAVSGELVAEYLTYEMQPNVLIADIDIDGINFLKRQDSTYRDMHFKHMYDYQIIHFHVDEHKDYVFDTPLNPLPFIPTYEQNQAVEQVFKLQVLSLVKRLSSMPKDASNIIIGISGGLDSTLALLCAHQAVLKLGRDPKSIIAVTMPSEITSSQTKSRAMMLMTHLGVTILDIPIQDVLDPHLKGLDHDTMDVTYENAQARIRTLYLMNLANKHQGFVLGTGDLSEIALGFMTYNGDHMSMYAINSGLPKTWVRKLITYYQNIYSPLQATLQATLDAPVTPELLKNQDSEVTIGRYDVNDFMLYHHLVQGADENKMVFLLKHAYALSQDEANVYVQRFFKRFYASQFKRQTMPEGPKLLNFSLSPRGEYRMPSDIKKG